MISIGHIFAKVYCVQRLESQHPLLLIGGIDVFRREIRRVLLRILRVQEWHLKVIYARTFFVLAIHPSERQLEFWLLFIEDHLVVLRLLLSMISVGQSEGLVTVFAAYLLHVDIIIFLLIVTFFQKHVDVLLKTLGLWVRWCCRNGLRFVSHELLLLTGVFHAIFARALFGLAEISLVLPANRLLAKTALNWASPGGAAHSFGLWRKILSLQIVHRIARVERLVHERNTGKVSLIHVHFIFFANELCNVFLEVGDSFILVGDLLHVLVALLQFIFLDLYSAPLLILYFVIQFFYGLFGVELQVLVLNVQLLVLGPQISHSSPQSVAHFRAVAPIIDKDISLSFEPIIYPHGWPFARAQIDFHFSLRLRILQQRVFPSGQALYGRRYFCRTSAALLSFNDRLAHFQRGAWLRLHDPISLRAIGSLLSFLLLFDLAQLQLKIDLVNNLFAVGWVVLTSLWVTPHQRALGFITGVIGYEDRESLQVTSEAVFCLLVVLLIIHLNDGIVRTGDEFVGAVDVLR